MNLGGQVLTVGGLWLVAVVIPGPNFLVVTRLAIGSGRAAAMRAVVGIVIGTVLWGTAGVLGVQTVFAAFPAVYGALQVAGAAWLLVVGLRTFRAAPQGAADIQPPDVGVRTGLLSSLSNPKSALLIGSLFTAVLTDQTDAWAGALMVAEIAVISFGWYALVSTVVASPAVARGFQGAGTWIDRGAGLVFIFFALRIIASRLGW